MNRIIKKAAAMLLAAVMIAAVPSCVKPRTSSAEGAVSAVWPVDKSYQKITTYFDPLRNESDASGYHNAIDIEAAYGTNVFAAYPGKCISSDWMDAYGNMVILYHEELGVYTFYAHCSSVEVSAGQAVSGGDIIGHVGSTGQSSGNHLHFGICDKLLSGWPCRTYYDPLTYFTYDSVAIANPNATPAEAAPACSCTAEYAGTYTTKGVTTYLNIRAGHGADTAARGQIPANAQFTVTKADGKWAHVEYNGVSGCVSMEYIQKVESAPAGCDCSESYAGTYTTKGVTTYLNIREGHSADTAAVGQIPPDARFEVSKADGKWAHVAYNGVSGCVSMDYIQKVETVESKMTIADQTAPAASVTVGSKFEIKGVITSNLTIAKVRGGVYKKADMSEVQVTEAAPNSVRYDLSSGFGGKIDISKLAEEVYIYKIEAEDTSGGKYTLINSEFTVVKAAVTTGDLNSDTKITISDAVLLQNYLLGAGKFTEQQFNAADMNGDKSVDMFDMILMRRKLVEAGEKSA
ncbi:MAG: peptidoglycan DD-metalloendopeptidase family protein [Ruminococcus sp.]|nr:peptidoglycan DD-metalloendopeptidase family protein [Ruminococcus sp.]